LEVNQSQEVKRQKQAKTATFLMYARFWAKITIF